jgi:hypothetical protein
VSLGPLVRFESHFYFRRVLPHVVALLYGVIRSGAFARGSRIRTDDLRVMARRAGVG